MPQDAKKMIFDRIQITEQFFGDLCSEVSSFTKKKARMRDKYDELARMFKCYGDTIRFNESLYNGISKYSKSCTLMADTMDTEVQRLQLKTINETCNYESVCKSVREALKHSLLARGKEHLKQRNQQRNTINDPKNPLDEEMKSNNDFEMNIVKFEQQKINDIRQILMDFTLIQLKETVKSMEILTTMYNDVASIDPDKDLEEFEEKCLHKSPNSLNSSHRSQSLSALTNNSKPLKRNNMSNSTMSLSSPNKDSDEKQNNNIHQTSDTESNEDDTTKTTDKSSESEEDDSDDSSDTKLSSENQSSYYDEDNDVVQVRSIKEIPMKKSEPIIGTNKRTGPVPQVRFSKLVNQMNN